MPERKPIREAVSNAYQCFPAESARNDASRTGLAALLVRPNHSNMEGAIGGRVAPAVADGSPARPLASKAVPQFGSQPPVLLNRNPRLGEARHSFRQPKPARMASGGHSSGNWAGKAQGKDLLARKSTGAAKRQRANPFCRSPRRHRAPRKRLRPCADKDRGSAPEIPPQARRGRSGHQRPDPEDCFPN